jgi:hypothetical protein
MSRRQSELDTIIGEHRMDFVGNGFDEGDKEGRCGNTIGFFDKLDEGELRSSVDRHEEVVPSAVCTSAMSMWKKPIG